MTYQTGPRIVTNGLVFCVDAADANSYPGSGTTWNDLSGNGNNGTLTNGPTFSSANRGSIVFDRANDYVDINNTFLAGSGTQFSTSCWLKMTTLPAAGNDSVILDIGNGTYDNLYLAIAVTTLKIHFNAYDGTVIGAYNLTANNSITLNVWTNIVGVHGSNSWTIYKDGVSIASTTGNEGSLTSASTNIGRFTGNSRFYGGNISSLTLYNRALSATEVLQNYNATKGRYGL